MTRVVDGVRRTSGRSTEDVQAIVRARREERAAALQNAERVSYGLDGMRRTGRQIGMPTPQPTMQPMLRPALAVSGAVGATWSLPALRLPQSTLLRQAALSGLVVLMIISSTFGVQQFLNAHTVAEASTANAASEAPQKAQPAVIAPAVTSQGVQQVVNQFVAANPGNWGIVVKDLSNGATATYQPTAQMESASLYKLFVARYIYQRIDLGQLSYTDPAGGGSGRDIQGCLTIMINISDNTCGRALGAILGWGDENQALQQEGYTQTDLATPQQTDAQDVGTLLERLYDGTLVSADSSKRFMDLLKDQQVNNRLPVGLPAGTIIAHKTGDLDGFTHDAGIVYGPKTNYLIVVMSGPWDEPGNAPAMFANLSQHVWNYFEN
jgi:beta-lactamase class A